MTKKIDDVDKQTSIELDTIHQTTTSTTTTHNTNDNKSDEHTPEKLVYNSEVSSTVTNAPMSKTVDTSKQTLLERFQLLIGTIIYTYWHYFLFNAREIRQRKIGFILGLASVLIVVLAVCISLSALAQLPIIFLRLAENNNGEVDIVLTPKSFLSGSTLNVTAFEQNFIYGAGQSDYEKRFRYFSPRYVLSKQQTKVFATNDCIDGNNRTMSTIASSFIQWTYKGFSNTSACSSDTTNYCISNYCAKSNIASLYLIDTEREKQMQLGREWKYNILDASYAYIASGLATTLNITSGDKIIIQVNLKSYFDGPYRAAGIITEANDESSSIPVHYTIFLPVTAQIIKSAKRKVSIYESDTIFMEYSHFMKSIAPYIHPQYTAQQRALLSDINLYEYAQQVVFNMPPSRVTRYNKKQFKDIKMMVTQFASAVLYYSGFDQLNPSYPMLDYMEKTTYFSLFLGLIVNIIIVILSILSLILIYSLLMISVENRTFELGVMRMIGTQRIGLLQLIFMQSLFFAIPGIILGLVIGQLGYLATAYIMSFVFGVEISKGLNGISVLVSVLLGLFIPIISSILPIRNALTRNLTDSLDTSRSKTKSVKYSIERSSEGGVSYSLIALGIIGAVLGFGTYYFFPLALLSLNLTLLLYMFFAVLVAMLFGLAILVLNVESILEHLITFVLFFWENEAIRHLIIKNLIAHRERNRKTTIMLSMSLGFIIFVSIAFNLQVQTFNYGMAQQYGTRLNIDSSGTALNDNILVTKLEKLCKEHPLIKGRFTYRSRSLTTVYNENRVQSRGGYASGALEIYAVPPNFLKVVRSRFLKVSEQHDGDIRSYNIVKQLYTSRGSWSIVLGTLYKKYLHLNNGINTPVILTSRLDVINGFSKYFYNLLKPMALLDSAPVFYFSKYPGNENQDALVSFPSWLRLSNGAYSTVTDIPIAKMFIEIDSVNGAQVNRLKREIKSMIQDYPNISMSDLDDELSPIRIAIQAINFFFLFTAAIAMFICFFSLMSSQYTNVQEQTKEIAVLRAIGVTRFMIVRLFIYESLVLVLAASVMGIAIGFVVAYTMSAQSFLFTQLPLDPIVPWQIMLLVIGLSFIFSVISAVFPAVALVRLPIVTLLKRIV
jgi:ABC-type antimicrobial peptide transport system permease subunit